MRNHTKIISLFLIIIMVLSIINIIPFSVSAAETESVPIVATLDEATPEIKIGDTVAVDIKKSVEVEKPVDIVYLKFMPENNTIITLTSLVKSYAVDTFCYLYDDQMNELANADGGGSFYNFKITYNVIGGNTYYFGVTLGDFNDSGSFSFDVLLTETSVWEHSGGTLTRYNGSDTNLSIPSKLDGETITSIGRSAFSGCENLTSVIIPDTVTVIGMQAFEGCSSLTHIRIPDSVISIDFWAFSGCESLSDIVIPHSVTSIDITAFSGCNSLKSIEVDKANINYTSISGIIYNKEATKIICVPSGIQSAVLPDTVTEIKMQDFANCESLTSVIIPESVKRIGTQAFSGCSSLSDITIPTSVIDIWYDAFDDTAWYNNQPEGVVYAGKVVYGVKGDCPSEVTIKDGTKGISFAAFRGCAGLESITFPDTIEHIGEEAFSGTVWLDRQPEGVIYAGNAAYGYKGEPSKILVIKEGTSSITDSAFEFGSFEKVLLPNSIKRIGTMAFAHCALTKVVIPEGVETIENLAFWDNPMTEATIPASVTYIGEAAFGYHIKSVEKIEGFIIRGYKGTAAEKYANDNGFTFIALGDTPKTGDADGDGEITVKDVTEVQHYLSNMSAQADQQTLMFADVDKNGVVNVIDTTWLLRYLAEMPIPYTIG